MAITDDTAALVAAQLTMAWATHVSPAGGHSAAAEHVLKTYLQFRDLVAERDIPGRSGDNAADC